MNVRACLPVCAVLLLPSAARAQVLLPAAAGAQQLTGLAAWTVGKTGTTYDDQTFKNDGFSQHYVLGLDSALIDSRLLTLSTEGSFRTNALNAGTKLAGQKGDQKEIGYKIGAAFFPQRSFPLTLQMSKAVVDESSQYPSTSAVRGSIVQALGDVQPAFQTLNRSVSATWQLNNVGPIPRVDMSYRSGRAETTGGLYHGAQQSHDVHLGMLKENSRMRHSVRYDRSATDNLVMSAYNQRNKDLAYDLNAILSMRSRMNVHAGTRHMRSQFDIPAQVVDPGAGAYSPPSGGDLGTQYLITSVTYEPAQRLSFDATGSLDRQDAAAAATGARLLVASARLDAGGGLSLNATSTYGDRQQVIDDTTINVVTRSGQAGGAFRTGPQWLAGDVVYNTGIGSNRTPEGISGDTAAWNGQASLSSTIGWFTVSVGEDRSRSRDQILDYGNATVLRDRASVQFQPGRFSLIGSWEDSVIDRGRGRTLVSVWQRTGDASAGFRLTRNTTLTANAGAFTNIGIAGTDVVRFWGGALTASPVSALHVSLWARHDDTTATATVLKQHGLTWMAIAEYGLREFSVAAEYRNNVFDLKSNPQNTRFRGRQMLFRITRKLRVPL